MYARAVENESSHCSLYTLGCEFTHLAFKQGETTFYLIKFIYSYVLTTVFVIN